MLHRQHIANVTHFAKQVCREVQEQECVTEQVTIILMTIIIIISITSGNMKIMLINIFLVGERMQHCE